MPLLAAQTLLELLQLSKIVSLTTSSRSCLMTLIAVTCNKTRDILTKGELSPGRQERRLRNYDPAIQPCKQGKQE